MSNETFQSRISDNFENFQVKDIQITSDKSAIE